MILMWMTFGFFRMAMPTSHTLIDLLHQTPDGRLISWNFDVNWPKIRYVLTPLAHIFLNQSMKSQKRVRTPEYIAAVAESVCEAPSTTIHRPSQQLNISEALLTLKTLVWRHTKFNWFRSWRQLTIQCVFASLSGPAIDLQKMPTLAKKKIIFSDEAHFDLGGYVNKQIVAFGAQKTRTHSLKSRRTQNERKGRAVTVNGDRYRAMLN